VLAHQPALLGPFLTWAAALALRGVIPRRDHEILALRTAWLLDSTFEWNEHVVFAHDAGLTDYEIEQIKAGAGAHDGAPHEAALVRATDELLADHDISEDVWNALAAHYSPGALIEIPFVIGQYAMLSMVANVIGA
jgi:alkylhydroperoxidase family enzyme